MEPIFFKNDLILNLVKDKSILHIGACDSPYSKQKYFDGTLLQALLNTVCNQIIGLDVDIKSIKELNELGLDNIFYGDIENGEYSINLKDYNFDYIILGDIIEHLNNPGIALNNIKKLLNNNSKVIITVPNCYSYGAIRNLIMPKEEVHPDHLFWTSKNTMEKMLNNQNFLIKNFQYCFYGSRKKSRLRKKLSLFFFKRYPRFLPCIFFEIYINETDPISGLTRH